ncbi:Uncharacterised protein [uncultured archaeon]|nr:Uncharacterised protein [uncultured archaeon]
MKIWCMIIVAAFSALVSLAMAASPIDAIAAPLQEQVNTAGQDLQQKAVQYIMEGNLTAEHIAQDLNATAENLTEQTRERLNSEINQKFNQSLNLTAEQISQRAAEELKNQVSQKMQAPGFEFILALTGLLAGIYVLRRRI